MKLSKLGLLYMSLCAIVAAVACSSEEANESSDRLEASGDPSGTVVVEKATDAGVITSDAAL
jgi:hypothetical protein